MTIPDAEQILAFYGSQERIVNRTVNVDDMEAIEKELKFFETNGIKLKNFEEKTRVLQGHANKLVTQNHFDSAFISKQVEEIKSYEEKILDLTKGREIYLNYMMTSLEFQRDVSEVEHWIAVRHVRSPFEFGGLLLETLLHSRVPHIQFKGTIK